MTSWPSWKLRATCAALPSPRPHLEITALADRVVRAGSAALLFENPTGHAMPVLANRFGTPPAWRLRWAWPLGPTEPPLRAPSRPCPTRPWCASARHAATNKWPGETQREWGRPMAMDAAVSQRMNALADALGL